MHELLEIMGIKGRMLKFTKELISESGRVHLTEQTDRPGSSTGRGAQCNPLPSGNQWNTGRIGKWRGWFPVHG